MNQTLKGSSWDSARRYTYNSYRRGNWPDYLDDSLGFRIARRREEKTPTVRGGSWFLLDTNPFRCAYRDRDGLTDQYYDNGFRLARRRRR